MEDTQGQIERSLPKVEKMVEEHEDIDVIMSLNDPTAMGALAALDSKDYKKDVLVYGVDGSPEGKRLISESKMTGTAVQYPRIYNRYGEGNLYCTKLFKSYYIFTNESGKNSHSDVCGIIYFSGNY